MTNPLDSFVADLQNEIFSQTKEEMGPEFFERWQNPRNMGKMDAPSTQACLTGECGDTMEIFLQIDNEQVLRATFYTTGCGPSVVSGQVACELAEDKDLESAAALEGADIINILKKMPPGKEHCAHLAAMTLREAIKAYWQKG